MAPANTPIFQLNYPTTPGDRCSECGTTLTDRATVHGTRQRRAWHVASAAVLLLIGIPLVTTLVDGLRAVDWIRYRPTTWLLTDLQATNAQTQRAALSELIDREFTFALQPEQRRELVAYCLALQADDTTRAGRIARSYLSDLFLMGLLTSDEVRDYLLGHLDLKVSPSMRWYLDKTDTIAETISIDLWRSHTITAALINGEPVDLADLGRRPHRRYFYPLNFNHPGKHKLSVTVRIEAFEGRRGDFESSHRLLEEERTLHTYFQIEPPTNDD